VGSNDFFETTPVMDFEVVRTKVPEMNPIGLRDFAMQISRLRKSSK